MNGFDIDGVITAGAMPAAGDVIITGRSYEEAPETYSMLHRKGIFNAVYFQPVKYNEKTIIESGQWKGRMCAQLGVERFSEDDPRQATIILDRNPSLIIDVWKYNP